MTLTKLSCVAGRRSRAISNATIFSVLLIVQACGTDQGNSEIQDATSTAISETARASRGQGKRTNDIQAGSTEVTLDTSTTTATRTSASTTIPLVTAAASAPISTSSSSLTTSGTANSIVLLNTGSTEIRNYPLQIGRVFKQGEMPSGGCPVVGYAGNLLPSQVDVKNRWQDGSLKFAVLSAVIPSVPSSSKSIAEIKPGSCSDSIGMRTIDLLQTSKDFDIVLELNGGVSGRASAREMISAGKFTEWKSGPVSLTSIISDHKTKNFDFGVDANRSLRPIFHVTSWPGFDMFKVRVILEVSDTTKLQDQTYSIRIKSGISSQTFVFESGSFTHASGARWTKEFWIGKDAPLDTLGIQHNVAYLASTYAIPNFDPTINVTNASIDAFVNAWSSAPKGPFESGLWTKYMPQTGGRPDIGLFPSWHILALYSGNPLAWSAVSQLTALAAAWPMNFRTGDSRIFDSASTSDANGRFVTRDAFPSQFLYAGNAYMNRWAAPTDQFKLVGVAARKDWVPDTSHQPDPWFVMYLTTGDFWYLEQLQFWASWGLFNTNPGSDLWASGRDSRDTVIADQVRGVAWTLRTRARAAWASVDSSPEKTYLNRSVEQALRQMEGVHIGAGGSTDPIRLWWASNGFLATNPLRFWEKSSAGDAIEGITASDVLSGTSPWQQSMLIQSLGHTTELGFNSGDLLAWFGQSWISLVGSSGVDPRHLADYRIPVTKQGGGFFQTWLDAFDGYTSWGSNWEPTLSDKEHGYAVFATSAISFLSRQPGGALAWSWANEVGYKLIDWSSNPKMAILPR